jgi:transposase
VEKRETRQDSQVQTDPLKSVFLEESGVHINMSRRYARARQGNRANDAIPLNKGQPITILSSVRADATTVPLIFPGAVNRDKLKEYLKDFLVPSLHPGDIAVLDNLPCHKVGGVAELIHSAGAGILYLPPYSPDFNPIEQMWSRIKAYSRMIKARTVDALLAAIPDAFATVGVNDILGWFECAGYCR